MLNYPFKNYNEFKEMFPVRTYGERRCRSNKILLSLFTSGNWIFKYNLNKISNMAQLEEMCMNFICENNGGSHLVCLGDMYTLETNLYQTDQHKGISLNGTSEHIRVIDLSAGKLMKIKAGKLLRYIIDESEITAQLPEPVKIYLCEVFTSKWKAYSFEKTNGYELVYDDNFEDMYSSCCCDGDFESCMTDRERHTFYSDCVKAMSAKLINKFGKICARAVVFTEVFDSELSEPIRLCERQYSADGDDILKQILVNKLIESNLIDGYKKIGANCRAVNAFLSNTGEDWSQKEFSIQCTIPENHRISFQDSFIFYDASSGMAKNFESYYTDMLNTTDPLLVMQYDSYHDSWCENVVYVHYDGKEYTCDVERLYNFRMFKGEYYYIDDIKVCPMCGDEFVDGFHSDVDGEDYCSAECLEAAEVSYEEIPVESV